jgi:hypothetical protein
MHNSQNGLSVNGGAAQNNLLTGTGCVGCHAGNGGNVGGTGKAATSPFAPQVDDAINTNNGGYFSTAMADSRQHNVADFLAENADASLLTIPGGTGTTNDGGGSPVLGCNGCHTIAGHHGAAGASYRMLGGTWANSTADADYGATTGGNGLGNRVATTYDGADMNLVCATCHPDFHEISAANSTEGTTVGDWIWVRHPVDITITAAVAAAGSPSVKAAITASDAVPIGANGGTDDVIMCISCHNAHGGSYDDLLSYDYNTNIAGGGTRGTGCETCHSYGILGM